MEYGDTEVEEGGMDAPDLSELKSHVLGYSREAETWIDSDIAPVRELATRYYKGEKFGNEEEGKSQIVLTEVRDSVLSLLPHIMRVFFSGTKAVEFMPTGPEDIETAEQATDYINHIVQKDNDGFGVCYAAFKDALVRKTGIIKWWWDESWVVTSHEFSGLSEQALVALLNEQGVEPVEIEQGVDSMGAPVFDVTIRRKKKKQRACISALPPEEFLVDKNARSIDDAEYVEHRSEKTPSDLIAMGYDRELIEGLGSAPADLQFNVERLARNPASNYVGHNVKRIMYREAWTKFDMDGDGIAELLKVCVANNELIHWEPTDEVPFATFCPDPEPHTFFGLSEADKVMDLQLIKSTMMRLTLDSATQSIHNRTWAVEGQVNMADVLNKEMGAVIRTRAPGMIGELGGEFIGNQMLPLMGYMDAIKESRTGQSKASQGLDADALQSTTRAAVSATVSAAAARQELVARIFAETGMKRLFKGLLRLVSRHQDAPRVVRLRNEWIPMDPRSWDAEMDVTVNVAIGAGTNEDRMGFLGMISAKQEQILQLAGMDNPLVNPINLYNTYSKMLELQGWKDPNTFFTDPRSWEPPPPQPDPAQMLAQLEMEKIRTEMATKAEDLRIKREQVMLEQDFKRDQLDADIILKSKELEMKYNEAVDVATIKAQVEKNRALA
jgi:hypothetical protein